MAGFPLRLSIVYLRVMVSFTNRRYVPSIPIVFSGHFYFWVRHAIRSHIVRALPDLWMNQAGSNSHKRGQSPLLLPVKLWFNIKNGFPVPQKSFARFVSYAIKAALGKGLSATTVCRFGNPDGTGGPRTQNHNPSYELDALTICATVPYKMVPLVIR